MRFLAIFSLLALILPLGFTSAFGQVQTSPANNLSTTPTATGNGTNPVAGMQQMAAGAITNGQTSQFFAPLGVFGAQMPGAGQWITAFTYGQMAANGMLNGSENESMAQDWKKYMMAPESADIDMYVFCIGRGITDNLAVMAIIPYSFRDMTMLSRKHKVFAATTDGLGDVQLGGTYRLWQSTMHELLFFGGISAPTGSIDARGNTPLKANAKLPYPLQLGTGTTDLHPTLTYMGHWEKILWGAQASGIIHLGYNWDGYRWGDAYELTNWVGYQLFNGLVGSFRLAWQSSGQISGADPDMNPLMAPGTDPVNFGGDRLLILPGLTWNINNGPLKGNKLLIEGGVPIYQQVTGVQGKMSYVLLAGFKCLF